MSALKTFAVSTIRTMIFGLVLVIGLTAFFYILNTHPIWLLYGVPLLLVVLAAITGGWKLKSSGYHGYYGRRGGCGSGCGSGCGGGCGGGD
ncbi:hypothetical protein N8778_01900 [Verrucomicrobia bacterium]|nr:hypothetical protein [Verrucomicrobiota bacterium]